MNAQSYQGTRKPDNCDHDEMKEIGDFSWLLSEDQTERHLLINAPNAEGTSRGVVAIPVKLGPNCQGQHWGWDGMLDTPTLTPSIHWIGHWHGYLTAGRLISC